MENNKQKRIEILKSIKKSADHVIKAVNSCQRVDQECKTCGDGIISPEDKKQFKLTGECMLHSPDF